jgi:5-methylcytosine-specific restriction protein A
MAFSQATKDAAFTRAGGQCECRRMSCTVHRTTYRCTTRLTSGRWHAHHRTAVASGGDDTLSNCEALCIPCHEQTQTYGAA